MTKSDSSKTYMFRILDVSPSLTGLLAQTLWRSPGSRAHCFLTCWESSTTPSPAAASDLTLPAGVAFPQAPKGRHSDCNFTELDGPPVSASVYASHSLLAETMARLEVRMESLLLFRRALSSPTMCRFIPALGAPCSPDFLSRLVALSSFMRLSVKKAVHTVVSRSRVTGNPGSPQRTWAENDVFECFYSIPELFSLEQLFTRMAKAFEGATPRLFRPTYAEANVGHPSNLRRTA
jgi:hypothetical protein